MNPALQKQFDRLEYVRKEIVSHISALQDHEYHGRTGQKWSIAQILTHILTSEKLALQYMKKKSLGIGNVGNTGPLERAKLVLLKISQRLPIKYKAPKGIQEKTPEALGKHELLKAWEEERENLSTFLNSISSGNEKRKIFKHPIAGMFNAAQGVAFLREHLLHHKPQIKRLISSHKRKAPVR